MHKITLIILITFICTGCASISRGVTEGVLGSRSGDKEDVRGCSIRGSKFQGLQSYLHPQKSITTSDGAIDRHPTLKVLMVHGIGEHLQGYSTRIAENLSQALSLNVVEARFKDISITHPAFPDQDLGKLRIHRFTNKQETKEMLFYELTWSSISSDEREIIAYDDSGEHSFRRATINNTMKGFMNSHVSYPLIYLGKSQAKIQLAVVSSFCWMLSRDWQTLDQHTQESCDTNQSDNFTELDDEFAFITHSMGSRIVTDSLQELTRHLEQRIKSNPNDQLVNVFEYLQKKQIPVFMLANQLPLLQLGREIPDVTNQYVDYCTNEGINHNKRFFRELTIVAFNDPNDILSYDVPPKFVDDFMDSRLCINFINVTINIAEVVELFRLGTFANPAVAHRDYDDDERVIGIITQGIEEQNIAPIVEERCTWLETR